jgi:hypothetical protein
VRDSARRGFADGLCHPLRALCPPAGERTECVTVRVEDLLMACAIRCVDCVHLVSGLSA